MKKALELHESRIDAVDLSAGNAVVHFSHAYIHKSKGAPGQSPGTSWSQEALLVLSGAEVSGPIPRLPNTISDGYLEVGGVKHSLLPLPFTRKVGAKLYLVFTDGGQLEIVGKRPTVELLGKAIFLEEFK